MMQGVSIKSQISMNPMTKGDFDWADVNGDGALDVFHDRRRPER